MSACSAPLAADIFSLPPVLGSCRALSEDFFAAWFAATKTTELPDLTTYSEEKLTKLRNAVASLLVAKVEVRAWPAASRKSYLLGCKFPYECLFTIIAG